ncbi:MAG: hypothetical protein OEZ01_09060 [Candidatus Heimdallarchaeota archaeon]|nr:hypothetical protein [Candidatus Heimdallarchaeota archaeon]MDH5646143.1 hypothetical protein [Candidatus Heimdallarchaeota archaeon]
MSTVGIQCKKCKELWRVELKSEGGHISVFAAICTCSAILVGNYDTSIDEIKNNDTMRKKYLSNGSFEYLLLSEDELQMLPFLDIE